MPSQRVYFENDSGVRLAGIVDLPESAPKAFALFSHCFTCTKDLKAIVRISRRLASHGIGVLRFDFTGLGDSRGDFSQANFDSSLDDIGAAVDWLSGAHRPPQLLIGHSMGGAAIMAKLGQVASARALVTIAAPSCTKHLAEFLSRLNSEIESKGVGQVSIGGRTHTIRRQLLASLRDRDLRADIERIDVPHLIFHSPVDATLDYRHAEEIFSWTGGDKSLITLSGSDHLLVSRPGDAAYVADLVAAWSSPFLGPNTG